MATLRGWVRCVYPEREYGIIVAKKSGKEFYVHATAVNGGLLAKNMDVEFCIGIRWVTPLRRSSVRESRLCVTNVEIIQTELPEDMEAAAVQERAAAAAKALAALHTAQRPAKYEALCAFLKRRGTSEVRISPRCFVSALLKVADADSFLHRLTSKTKITATLMTFGLQARMATGLLRCCSIRG